MPEAALISLSFRYRRLGGLAATPQTWTGVVPVRHRILGPLSVADGGEQVPITAGRDRVVLAVLGLHAGRCWAPAS
jgi:hypothetical protein